MGRSLTLVLLLGSMSLASVVPAQVTGEDALLGRWREIRELVHTGQIPPEQWREAAMVMALAQFYRSVIEGDTEEYLEWVHASLGTVDDIRSRLLEALDAYDAPGDSYANRRGSFFAPYLCGLDQAGHFYSLYVPEDYDPQTPMPLLVLPKTMRFKEPTQVAGSLPFLIVHAVNRGIDGLGELDCREAIRDVQRHYRVDPNRIYLRGASNAGDGVWRMLARYPDLFAGALIDYGFTHGVNRLHLENVSNIPIWLYHDTTDRFVPVEESRAAAHQLRALGSPIVYSETTGFGHSSEGKNPDWRQMEWLLAQSRDPYPADLHYTTSTPTRGRAYWVEILAFQDANALARVSARVRLGKRQTQLFLHLDNVAVLRVELPRELFPADKPLAVMAGGAPTMVAAPLPPRIFLNRGTTDSIEISRRDPRPPTPHRPYVSGGINDMFISGEPLMIVRGTGGDNRELLEAIEGYSRMLARANKGWAASDTHECLEGWIPVVTDTALTAEDIQTHNLVLLGPVTANRVLARLTTHFPAVERDRRLDIGGESYDLTQAGYGLLHYNPGAPQRMVLVVSSSEPAFYQSLENGVSNLMTSENPFGLLVRRIEPSRMVRRIAWTRDWQIPKGAFAEERLPEAFTEDRDRVRYYYHQAACEAAGVDVTGIWRTYYYPLWESGARWHDLACEIGHPRVWHRGVLSGADVMKLSESDKHNPKVTLDIYVAEHLPGLNPEGSYRYVTGSAWAIVNTLGHGLRSPEPVRFDQYRAIRRLASRVPRP